MLHTEALDIVAIATNTKGRADLTCLAVDCGVKGIATEKPMAHTLGEADRMVEACADAGVPLCCGAIPVNHPSYAKAKELVNGGAIGELLSIETEGHQRHRSSIGPILLIAHLHGLSVSATSRNANRAVTSSPDREWQLLWMANPSISERARA